MRKFDCRSFGYSLAAVFIVSLCELVPAQASVININFVDNPAHTWTDAEKDVANTAAQWWMNALPDPRVSLAVDMLWGAVPAGAIKDPSLDPSIPRQASETLAITSNLQLGLLGAPIFAEITIDPRFRYFIDGTPTQNNEFLYLAVAGIIDFRTYLAKQNNPALNGYDLLTLIEHELGHAVGFTDTPRFNSLSQKCDPAFPLSDTNSCLNLGPDLVDLAGEDLQLLLEGDGLDNAADISPSSALNEIVHFKEAGNLQFDLMSPIQQMGMRHCPSAADIWALHLAYGYQVNTLPVCDANVPEPRGLSLIGIGFFLLHLTRLGSRRVARFANLGR